ncbi:hypothetical protein D3C73_1334740 [compost metagenome]
MSADTCLNAFAFGIDFTLRDVQSALKKKGHPWTAAKGFKSSAPVTPFLPLEQLDMLELQDFSLLKNGQEVGIALSFSGGVSVREASPSHKFVNEIHRRGLKKGMF